MRSFQTCLRRPFLFFSVLLSPDFFFCYLCIIENFRLSMLYSSDKELIVSLNSIVNRKIVNRK